MLKCALIIAATLIISACGSSYTIKIVDGYASRMQSEEAAILFEAPERTYKIIAEFKGHERGDCPGGESYCSLREHAMELGVDAIWIQSHSVYKHHDEWVMIEGRLTKIYHPAIETISGVLIRYTD